jgi:hypothetical protein
VGPTTGLNAVAKRTIIAPAWNGGPDLKPEVSFYTDSATLFYINTLIFLKGSDDGVLHTELLFSWTFSIVWYSREQNTRRFGNWICFRPQVKGGEDTYSVGPLRKS